TADSNNAGEPGRTIRLCRRVNLVGDTARCRSGPTRRVQRGTLFPPWQNVFFFEKVKKSTFFSPSEHATASGKIASLTTFPTAVVKSSCTVILGRLGVAGLGLRLGS